MITHLEHVGLGVADLERSVAFYRDVIGFSVRRILEPRDDSRLGVITGMPGARARIAHLVMGQNMLELFQYIEPAAKSFAHDRSQADKGYIHMGLHSGDVRSDYDRLRAAGVEFLSAPVEFRPGVWVAYFRGPDGEVIELRQGD